MVNRHIYHYAARRQVGAALHHYDGIALLNTKVVNHDIYQELKGLIDETHADKLTITSLTYLGEEEE